MSNATPRRCPFCNSSTVKSMLTHVRCLACHAHGPMVPNVRLMDNADAIEKAAVTAWNGDPERERLFSEMAAALKSAADLYDAMAYGPLDGAAHFGPDWEPPSEADYLAVRGEMDAVLARVAAMTEAGR